MAVCNYMELSHAGQHSNGRQWSGAKQLGSVIAFTQNLVQDTASHSNAIPEIGRPSTQNVELKQPYRDPSKETTGYQGLVTPPQPVGGEGSGIIRARVG